MKAPSYRRAGLLGNIQGMRETPLEFLSEAHEACGAVARFRLGWDNAYLVTSPETIKRVLVDEQKRYDRNMRQFSIIGLALGQSLLTTTGEFWLRQRRTAQPAFHGERIRSLTERMTNAIEQQLQKHDVGGPGESSKAFSFARLAFALSFEVIVQTMFSSEGRSEESQIAAAIEGMIAYVDQAMTAVLLLPQWVPSRRNREFARAKARVDGFCDALIESRHEQDSSQTDLLSLLMAARDVDTGHGFERDQLRNEVKTMLLAGHETVANTLCWAVALLHEHPEIYRAATAEVDAVLAGRRPSYDLCQELSLITKIIKETLRLYPPGWLIGRNAAQDDEINGYEVRKGSMVFAVPYVMHRSLTFWEHPLRFDPERFSKSAEAARPRHGYLPFGMGPHVCIGQGFAMLELQVVLSMLLQRYEIRVEASRRPRPLPRITLGLKDTLPVRLVRRASRHS